MQEALLYDRLEGRKVRCNLCQRRCLIDEGKRGYCWSRLNRSGKLYTLTYGKVSSMAVSPIEKKPLFHFLPGSLWLSLGTLGCNFRCPGCQNWEIAHAKAEQKEEGTEYISPERSVQLAKRYGCAGISWTYNEPTIWFEYTLEGARLAKENNLLTNYVTNGYITEEALDVIGPYLDAFRVDIKGFSKEFYQGIAHIADFAGILEVTKRAKKRWGMHVEIVTNIIPGYSDDEVQLRGIASWIYADLGEETPWHLTRFVPHLELSHLDSTPIATLERARQIGYEVGLWYVYLGNVPGHPGENTYCYRCKALLVKRDGYSIVQNRIVRGRCPDCLSEVAGRFKSHL